MHVIICIIFLFAGYLFGWPVKQVSTKQILKTTKMLKIVFLTILQARCRKWLSVGRNQRFGSCIFSLSLWEKSISCLLWLLIDTCSFPWLLAVLMQSIRRAYKKNCLCPIFTLPSLVYVEPFSFSLSIVTSFGSLLSCPTSSSFFALCLLMKKQSLKLLLWLPATRFPIPLWALPLEP